MNVVVVGAGAGGLAAAIALAAAGRRVRVYEAQQHVGGKIGTAVVGASTEEGTEEVGVEVDTGPTVLTLPEVVEAVFARGRARMSDHVTLVRPSPAFRYCFADSETPLDVFVDVNETLASVRSTLGADAEHDLAAFLKHAKAIWDASKDDFVFAPAPTLPRLVRLALLHPVKLFAVDALRSMATSIEAQVRSPELRLLLLRYASYNGSDPYTAPATLSCIAHVELALGGFGVKGGMAALARALRDVAERVGVEFVVGARVDRVVVEGGRARGVDVGGSFVSATDVVVNADVGWLRETKTLAPSPSARLAPSMSGATAILKAKRRPQRVAHEVLFSRDYAHETRTIFDEARPPDEPTIYLCALEKAHARRGWRGHEPVFAMINVPPLGARGTATVKNSGANDGGADLDALERGLERARVRGLVERDDSVVWTRDARALARDFPGSHGSLYGASSNDRSAAFLRPKNQSDVEGLFLASGSAHPGGGVPLCLQSGLLAADALLRR